MNVKVIKNGSRYYSCLLGGERRVLAFTDDKPLKKCQKFLKHYKTLYSTYPPADGGLRKPTVPEESEHTYICVEEVDNLQRYCHMYSVGLTMVERFEYSFTNERFDIDVAAEDILPPITDKERANLLNYALIIND
jgi:hypothetical protein